MSEFLLTRPSRDVTDMGELERQLLEFLLTRPSRDVTKATFMGARTGVGISTHTPLAGRDNYFPTFSAERMDFYSHAPRGT